MWWADEIKATLNIGVYGWATVVTFACALGLTVGIGASLPWAKAWPNVLPRLYALTSVSLLLSIAASALIVSSSRRVMTSGEPPLGVSPFWVESFEWLWASWAAERGLALIGGAVLLAAAVTTLHLGLAPRRGARRSGIAWGGVVAIGAVTALGILRRTATATVPFLRCETGFTKCVNQLQAAAAGPIGAARFHVLVTAAVSFTIGIVLAMRDLRRREGRAVRRNDGFGFGAAIFTVGLGAYAGTRPLAHDAARWLPRPPGSQFQCSVAPKAVAGLPQALRCGLPVDSLVLDMTGAMPALDGVHASDAAELRVRLNSKRRLSLEVTQKPLPPIVLAVPSASRISDLAPYLSAVRDAWGSETVVMSVAPGEVFSTDSLGDIRLQRRCCHIHLQLVEHAGAPTSYLTWGEITRAAAEAPSPFALGL